MPSHSSYSYVMFIMIHFITVVGALSPIRWLVIYGFRHFLKKLFCAQTVRVWLLLINHTDHFFRTQGLRYIFLPVIYVIYSEA